MDVALADVEAPREATTEAEAEAAEAEATQMAARAIRERAQTWEAATLSGEALSSVGEEPAPAELAQPAHSRLRLSELVGARGHLSERRNSLLPQTSPFTAKPLRIPLHNSAALRHAGLPRGWAPAQI